MKINLGTVGGIIGIVGTAIAVAVWFTEWRTTENFRSDALESRIENLETHMDTRMDNLETRMDNLEAEIRALRALIIERLPAK